MYALQMHFFMGVYTYLQSLDGLNELIPNPSGVGYYVVYPPMPAFLMTPLVAIFGTNLNRLYLDYSCERSVFCLTWQDV